MFTFTSCLKKLQKITFLKQKRLDSLLKLQKIKFAKLARQEKQYLFKLRKKWNTLSYKDVCSLLETKTFTIIPQDDTLTYFLYFKKYNEYCMEKIYQHHKLHLKLFLEIKSPHNSQLQNKILPRPKKDNTAYKLGAKIVALQSQINYISSIDYKPKIKKLETIPMLPTDKWIEEYISIYKRKHWVCGSNFAYLPKPKTSKPKEFYLKEITFLDSLEHFNYFPQDYKCGTISEDHFIIYSHNRISIFPRYALNLIYFNAKKPSNFKYLPNQKKLDNGLLICYNTHNEAVGYIHNVII